MSAGVPLVPQWAIGVGLSLVGCLLDSLSINTQKLAHRAIAKRIARTPVTIPSYDDQGWMAYCCGQKAAKPHGSSAMKLHEGFGVDPEEVIVVDGNRPHRLPVYVRCYIFHPLWFLGVLLLALGAAVNIASYRYASMSLIAPMGAVTTGLNMGVGPLIFRERLDLNTAVWTVVILLGTSSALATGPKVDQSYTLDELILRFEEQFYLTYMVVFVFCLAVLQLLSHRLGRLMLIAYPAMAGGVGSFNVLFVKSAVEALVEETAVFRWETWGFIGMTVVCTILQIRFLNKGLTLADAILVLPTYQAFWVTGNVLNGMVFFKDYDDMTTISLIVFSISNAVTLGAVFGLARSARLADEAKAQQNTAKELTESASEEGCLGADGGVELGWRLGVAHVGEKPASDEGSSGNDAYLDLPSPSLNAVARE